MILENNVDPTIKNKAGQLPTDLLTTGDPNRHVLNTAMQKRGNTLMIMYPTYS